MKLPSNYRETLVCVNRRGATAEIWSNQKQTEAYKIYYGNFPYEEQKFNAFLSLNNPNCFSPKDLVFIEGEDLEKGYSMNFDDGKSLRLVQDESLDKLISAADLIAPTIEDITSHHFSIVDANIENITFSDAFKFVDVYAFAWLKQYRESLLYRQSINRMNVSICCGIIDINYRKILELYFRKINYKGLDYFLKQRTGSKDYVKTVLTLVQEATNTDSLREVKQLIK